MAFRKPQIDSTIEIITPENISFSYRVAGPMRRLLAYTIDLGIRGAILLLVALIGGGILSLALGSMWLGILIVTWFLLGWFYGGVFETFMNGQTPGKRMMGVRVLTSGGQPINGMQAIMRNILRTVDLMPMMSCALGALTMASNTRFQRLGDIVCDTMVVLEERHWLTGIVPIDDRATLKLAAQIPPDYEAHRSTARAIAAYVERRGNFSKERRLEIAQRLAAPLAARFRLPADTDHDLLLCALYFRLFIADHAAAPQAGRDDALQAKEVPGVLSSRSKDEMSADLIPLASMLDADREALQQTGSTREGHSP